MARVKFSAIVSEISGSVGSATFQRSIAGPILRNRPRTSRTPSPAQLERRAMMMQVHAAWAALGADQRHNWDQFINYSGATVRRDRSVRMTGYALFLKYNYMRLLATLSILTTPVYAPMPAISTAWEFREIFPSPVIDFDAPTPGADYWLLLRMSSLRTENNKFSPRGLRNIIIDTAEGNPFSIGYKYKEVFGVDIVQGDWFHYELVFFSKTAPMITGRFTGVSEIQ